MTPTDATPTGRPLQYVLTWGGNREVGLLAEGLTEIDTPRPAAREWELAMLVGPAPLVREFDHTFGESAGARLTVREARTGAPALDDVRVRLAASGFSVLATDMVVVRHVRLVAVRD